MDGDVCSARVFRWPGKGVVRQVRCCGLFRAAGRALVPGVAVARDPGGLMQGREGGLWKTLAQATPKRLSVRMFHMVMRSDVAFTKAKRSMSEGYKGDGFWQCGRTGYRRDGSVVAVS